MQKLAKPSLSHAIHAWAIWLLGAFFMFYKYALEVSPSVMTHTLMSAFNIGGVDLGNLAAVYFYAYLILQIPAGLLLDRFGPRATTTIAIILCAGGNFVFAEATSLFSACLGRFLTGIGAAFAAVNCLKLISIWFPPKKFAFMAGLMMTVAMLGAVGGQAPLATFMEKVDWRIALKIISCIGVATALIFWCVVRDESPYHKKEKKDKKSSLVKSLKSVLVHPQSWWLSAYSGFAFAPVMVFGGLWGVSYIIEAFKISSNMSAQSVSMIFVGFAVGAPIFGLFSDWLGKRKPVMVWGTIAALISISLVIYLPSITYPILALLLFLFGFFISSFLLCFTMIQEIHSVVLAGAAIGFMNAFDAFFGAFTDPLTGKILDIYWDGVLVNGARVFSPYAYRVAFLTIPLYLLISLLFLIPTKETHCKAHTTPPPSLP